MNHEFSLAALSLPAMLVAGLASSAHCALMCGLLQSRARAGGGLARHAGRLAAYALLGALAGGAGHWLLRAAAWLPTGDALRLAALPLLLLLVVRRPRTRSAAPCCAAARGAGTNAASQMLAGFLTGLVPCVLLYAAAAYAALSGSAAEGALLMLAFGLGTVPAVQASAWAWIRFGATAQASLPPRRVVLGGGLLGAGVLLLVLSGGAGGVAAWCLSR